MVDSNSTRYNVENARAGPKVFDPTEPAAEELIEAEDRPATRTSHESRDLQRDWETDEWVAICSCGWTSNQRREQRHVIIEWQRHRTTLAN